MPSVYQIPDLELEDGNGSPLQYSCLENPIDRGAWQATVHGVARVRYNLATKPPQVNTDLNIAQSLDFTSKPIVLTSTPIVLTSTKFF